MNEVNVRKSLMGRAFWLKLASFGLFFGIAGMLSSLSAEAADLIGIKTDSGQKQVILTFSETTKGTLMAPFDKGQRRLILDIPGASLASLQDKKALLRALQNELPELATISLDEFNTGESLVRLVIKTREPEITGALIRNQDSELVIQLLQSPAAIAMQPESYVPVNHTSTNPEETAPPPTLSGRTAMESVDSTVQRKLVEHELFRKQMNILNDQIANLHNLVNDQNKMINHLKEEQQRLVMKTPNEKEKAEIASLNRELKDLEKSYDQMKKILESYRKQVSSFDTQATQQVEGRRLPERASTPPPITSGADAAQKDYLEAQRAANDGDMERAAQAYRQAMTKAPQNKTYPLELASLHIRMKSYKEAQQVLEAALKTHPDDLEILNELGKVALLQKNEAEALDYFRQAIPAGVLSNYASTLRRMNKLDEAEAVYKLAIASSPKDSDLQYNLGNLYLSRKRFADAEGKFSEALKLNPEFAEAHFHLGLVYAEQGKGTKAITHFNQYLKLMPQAPNKSEVENYIKGLSKSAKSG